jgi:hypothetical protein
MLLSNSTRIKLAEGIMKEADFISEEGSMEEAKGMYYVGQYIETGMWPWKLEISLGE